MDSIRTTLSQAELYALLDSAPDAMVIADHTGNIVFVNAQAKKLFGYARTELLGKPIEVLLPRRFRLNHEAQRSAYATSPTTRPMGTGLELYGLRKDGEEFPVEISLSPLQTEAGPLVSSAIRDISGRKEIERQLLEANQAKSRFLAAASHDLRQPIQTLTLLNRVAKRAATDPTQKAIIEKQQRSLDSMSRLLSSLLDISKLEAGIVKPDITDCVVQQIFDDLRAEFEEQAQDKGLELIIERCDDVARSDPRLLTQILENLVSNAIKYTREGFIRLRCLHRDLGIRIEVLDTGLGIPANELERIFDEFHQVDRGSSRPDGLGLGLSIVKRTAELLGCSLDVASAPGEGSVFSVTVPKGTAAEVRDVPAGADPFFSGAAASILIVDDEPEVAAATGILLEVEGFDVLTAASAEEAATCIEEFCHAPDLIITDYHLRGGQTGLDVVREVRARLGCEIPVIFVSGDTSDRAASEELGDAAFLKKPVNVDELLAEIRRRVRRSTP